MYTKGVGLILILLIFFSLVGGMPVQAQEDAPVDTATPTITITPTPEPTQLPAMLFIEATQVPTPEPQGGLVQQVWDTINYKSFLGPLLQASV